MLKFQLWIGHHLIEDTMFDNARSVNRAIDARLTEVHAGKHGPGVFRIEADHTDKTGALYQGKYYASGPIVPQYFEVR